MARSLIDPTINLSLRFENALLGSRPRPHLPVILLTGFLGSGKTTLMRHILRNRANLRVAAAVSDFGRVNLDALSVERHGPAQSVALGSGCGCCQVEGALETELFKALLDRDDAVADYLIVECNGVTDPSPVIASLEKSFGKMARMRLDAVVCVVDSETIAATLRQSALGPVADGKEGQDHERTAARVARAQLAVADIVLLNKTDLVAPAMLEEVRRVVRAIAPLALVRECSYSAVAVEELLSIIKCDAAAAAASHERAPSTFLVRNEASTRAERRKGACTSGGQCAEHGRHDSFASHAEHRAAEGLSEVSFVSDAPFALARFQDWVLRRDFSDIHRMKGTLFFDEMRAWRYCLHQSGRRRRIELTLEERWQSQPRVHLNLVVAGVNRHAVLEAELAALCVANAGPSAPLEEAEGARRLHAAARSVLQDDELFSVQESLDASSQVIGAAERPRPALLVLRLEGTRRFRISEDEVVQRFQVDFDALNAEFVRTVNMRGKGALLCPALDEKGRTVSVVALCSGRYFEAMWPVLREEGRGLVDLYFRRVTSCLCGR